MDIHFVIVKKTKLNDVNRYLREKTDDRLKRIKNSAVSDRMQYIDPKVYIDMNTGVISEIYSAVEDIPTFKGFNVFAIDGSVCDIPTVPLTRQEFKFLMTHHLKKKNC